MDIKSQDQGLTPVTTGIDPVMPPAPAADPTGPQTPDADGQAAAPMAAVEPVPLPKVTDVEKPVEPVAAAAAEVVPVKEEVNPLFEKPVTVAPGDKDEGRRTKDEGHSKFPKGVIAGIAALVFLVVGGLVIIPNRIARDPDWGYIGIAAGNGCSNGLCPVINTDGKIQGYIKADAPVVGTYQDVLDARANLVVNNLDSKEDQQRIQEAPSVKVEENRVVRNEDTGRVETTDGGQIPTYDEVKTHLQKNNLANSQENVNQVVEQVNSGTSGTAADSGSSDTSSVGGDAAGCAAFHGDGNAVRQCLLKADSGKYKSGQCAGVSDKACLALGTPVYCSGPQSGMESERGGEFLTCGGSSTNNCGQVDVYYPEDVENGVAKPGAFPRGFIIDKSGCGGQPQVTNDAAPPREIPPPQMTTEEAPPREFPPEPTPPPGATATPTPVTVNAFCSSLVGQISDGAGGWTTKTDAEFSAAASPGDRVRFVCTGAKNRGRFTKSAFFINSVLHIDDVVKLAEDQYSVEYAIPAAGALKVESVLLHDSKGWVD